MGKRQLQDDSRKGKAKKFARISKGDAAEAKALVEEPVEAGEAETDEPMPLFFIDKAGSSKNPEPKPAPKPVESVKEKGKQKQMEEAEDEEEDDVQAQRKPKKDQTKKPANPKQLPLPTPKQQLPVPQAPRQLPLPKAKPQPAKPANLPLPDPKVQAEAKKPAAVPTSKQMKKGPSSQEAQKPQKPSEAEEKKEEGTQVVTNAGSSKRAAWVDEDDVQDTRVSLTAVKKLRKLRKDATEETIQLKDYEQRLRNQFLKMHPNQSWAAPDDQEDIEVLQTTQSLYRKSDVLPQDFLSVSRVRDANVESPSESVIHAVAFHSGGRVLMTAGYDKTIRLFQIDGKTNEKIQAVFFDRMPIHTAHFSADGTTIFASGRRKFFYAYDIEKGKVDQIPWIQGYEGTSLERFEVSPCGKYLIFLAPSGHIVLVSAKTRQFVGNLKMNGTVNSLAFTADGRYLFSFGGDGEVYKWDMDTHRCVQRFKDEGCVHGYSIACSKNGQFLACGSDSGVVNLYDLHAMDPKDPAPKPIKSILNLTTPVTHLKFNHDSNILGMASSHKPDALRLLHTPSRTVFSNFPNNNKGKIGEVFSFDFSPSSGYLVIGNSKGKAQLYRLNHYPSV